MTDDQGESRLEKAIRRHRRQRALPRLLGSLQRKAGIKKQEVGFMTLSESEGLNRRFDGELERRRGAGIIKTISSLCEVEFERCAKAWLCAAGDRSLWVMLAHWSDVGAILFDSARLRECVGDLLRLDGDTIWGGTQDLGIGFVFDYTLDENAYRIEFWGAEE